jgi:hypothetical protein
MVFLRREPKGQRSQWLVPLELIRTRRSAGPEWGHSNVALSLSWARPSPAGRVRQAVAANALGSLARRVSVSASWDQPARAVFASLPRLCWSWSIASVSVFSVKLPFSWRWQGRNWRPFLFLRVIVMRRAVRWRPWCDRHINPLFLSKFMMMV